MQRGGHHPEETKLKMSIAHKGRPHSAEHKANLVEALKKVHEANKGRHHTEESKLKTSLALKGRPLSARAVEVLRKLHESNKGVPRTEETKTKLRQVNKGKHHTPEAKLKMSLARKGVPLSEENKLHISQAKIGHTVSEVTRLKISLAQKGVPLSAEHKANSIEILRKVNEAHRGVPRSTEDKLKMSQSLKQLWTEQGFRETHSGENAPRWLGGKSFEPYSPEFSRWKKRLIKDRDNNQCRLCGSTIKLCVHHIDYDKLNSDPQNLISLCNYCHGKTTSVRDCWREYLLFKNESFVGRSSHSVPAQPYDIINQDGNNTA